MNAKFITALAVVAVTIGVLVYFASSSTAKEVVRVPDLVPGQERGPVQLGARVSSPEIKYSTEPERIVSFSVKDPADAAAEVAGDSHLSATPEIDVIYYGALPDTLRTGRDVILQGKYDGEKFIASSLLTQCPSKYVPPVPGGAAEDKPAGYGNGETSGAGNAGAGAGGDV